jgi:hypothetical protein
MVDVPSRDEFSKLEARVKLLEENGGPIAPIPVLSDFTDPLIWVQTFNEEFQEPELDIYRYWEGNNPPGRWKTFFYFGDRVLNGNGERQYYLDKWFRGDGKYNNGDMLAIDPFKIENGILKISAEHSDLTKVNHYWGYPYTSGLITTEPSFSQTYGRFLARMKLPKGKGLWPAFWLLPVDKSWPPEIDPLEFFGGTNSRNEGGVTWLHYGGHSMPDKSGSFGTWLNTGKDLTADFHVFGCEVDQQKVRFFVDDNYYAEAVTPKDWNKPFYMLVNLAIGGPWAEAPDATTKFPAVLEVDYVRAYRRK